jgi:hypothetical protein
MGKDALMKIMIILSLMFSHLAFAQNNIVTAPVPAIKEERTFPRWGVSYFNVTNADFPLTNYGGGNSLSIYQYFSINYILNSDERWGFKVPFTVVTPGFFNSAGETRPYTTYPGDLHVTYSNYNIAKLADWKFSGTFYLYFPTTQNSIDKMWLARTAAWFIFENKVNDKWTLYYNVKPDFYFNTQKSFRADKSKALPDGSVLTDVFPEANQLGKLDHYFQVSRVFSRNLSLQLDVGLVYEWYADSQWTNKALLAERFKFAPNVNFAVAGPLRFIFGIENKIDIRTPRKDFAFFREEESSYYLMTFLTLL